MPAILSHYLAGHCVDEPNQIVYVLAGAHDRTINNYEVYEVSELILVIFVIMISCQMKKSEFFPSHQHYILSPNLREARKVTFNGAASTEVA